MDYREWIERARGFIELFESRNPGMRADAVIDPPASLEQVMQVEAAIGQRLPEQLRNFLLTASGGCNFGYWWEPESEVGSQAAKAEFGKGYVPGGLECFASCDSLVNDYEFQKELVEEGQFGDSNFCRNPLPIGDMGNGDHIAIDLNGGSVVFLAHDEASFVLAPDFDSFLTAWEAICYADFDMSPYKRFLKPDGTGIDANDRPELRRLRELLLAGS